jgi:hypothetical protein
VIDAQSVKTPSSVPAAGQGIDAGKKIMGRKRNIVTGTLGLLLAVLVTAASVRDSAAGARLLDQVAADHPGIRKVWVDGATVSTSSSVRRSRHRHGNHRPQARDQGFRSDPEAVGGGTDLWLAHAAPSTGPRLRGSAHPLRSRDPHRYDRLMARRLTGENTISWRDPTPRTKQ